MAAKYLSPTESTIKHDYKGDTTRKEMIGYTGSITSPPAFLSPMLIRKAMFSDWHRHFTLIPLSWEAWRPLKLQYLSHPIFHRDSVADMKVGANNKTNVYINLNFARHCLLKANLLRRQQREKNIIQPGCGVLPGIAQLMDKQWPVSQNPDKKITRTQQLFFYDRLLKVPQDGGDITLVRDQMISGTHHHTAQQHLIFPNGRNSCFSYRPMHGGAEFWLDERMRRRPVGGVGRKQELRCIPEEGSLYTAEGKRESPFQPLRVKLGQDLMKINAAERIIYRKEAFSGKKKTKAIATMSKMLYPPDLQDQFHTENHVQFGTEKKTHQRLIRKEQAQDREIFIFTPNIKTKASEDSSHGVSKAEDRFIDPFSNSLSRPWQKGKEIHIGSMTDRIYREILNRDEAEKERIGMYP